jgi:hypothetical protein
MTRSHTYYSRLLSDYLCLYVNRRGETEEVALEAYDNEDAIARFRAAYSADCHRLLRCRPSVAAQFANS